MQDSKILYFLRSFPAWIPLLFLYLFLVLLYQQTGDVAYKEWASLALASLFTALGIQRSLPVQPGATTTSGDILLNPSQPKTEVVAETVNADVKTDSVSIQKTDGAKPGG